MTNVPRIITIVSGALALAATGACKVEGALRSPAGSSGTSKTQQQRPPSEQPPQGGGGGGGATAGGGGAGGPSCPNADNHCLDPDTYFMGDKGWEKGWIWVKAAKMTSQPNASGEARLMSLKDGEELTTQHFWSTRPASPDELRVGQMAVMLHEKDDDGSFRRPEDRDEAHGDAWWLGRIISVAPLAQAGEVIVSSGYRVNANAVRLIEGDEHATVVMGGTEDKHFLKPEHWIVGEKPLPDKGWKWVHIGAPIQQPSAETNGDGQFINLHDGHTFWTKHAWRTRPATKNDVKLGMHVFMLHEKDQDGNFRAPKERTEGLSDAWWVGKVTDTSELYKDVIQVSGKYRVNLNAARVIVQ